MGRSARTLPILTRAGPSSAQRWRSVFSILTLLYVALGFQNSASRPGERERARWTGGRKSGFGFSWSSWIVLTSYDCWKGHQVRALSRNCATSRARAQNNSMGSSASLFRPGEVSTVANPSLAAQSKKCDGLATVRAPCSDAQKVFARGFAHG
jgi:hypothetical protein